MLVSEVMTARPVAIRPDVSVKYAVELLAEHGITSLPVVDPTGRIEGVVSEADLIKDLVPPDRRAHLLPVVTNPDRPRVVADVMTSDAVTIRPETDVADAVDLFTSTAVKCVPVVDELDLVVGVLSRADVVRALARADDELRTRVSQVLGELGLADWLVEVHDGVAELDGPGDSAALAEVAAAAVPGVLRVSRRSPG